MYKLIQLCIKVDSFGKNKKYRFQKGENMISYELISNYILRRLYMEKGELQAVHDDDLITLLNSLGEYNNVIEGKRKCFFCDKTITIENISSVFPFEKNIEFCCSDDECYKKLLNFDTTKGE